MSESKLLSVDEALARVLSDATRLGEEDVALGAARSRTLAQDLIARRTQPPIDVSAMDGYALRAADLAAGPLKLVGESAAGHGYGAPLNPGEAVRIFTGAPVPAGADAVLLQEDAETADGALRAKPGASAGDHIRTAGLDFREGHAALAAGRRLGPAELALAAAMNHATLPVARRPRVALIASGDELVPPGAEPGPSQIIASNSFAVAAIAEDAGAEVVDLGIFRDDLAELERAIVLARAAEADVIVTLGGASVGDHDLLRPALARQGMTLDFWKIAMRPGKPLIWGRLGRTPVLGLPGNPVSALVCAVQFLVPAIAVMSGLPGGRPPTLLVRAGSDLPANDQRFDHLRASLGTDRDGRPVATPFPVQDSSMLKTLARAEALILRPPHAPALPEGAEVEAIPLGQFGI
jgi:molybdopterin molybdotransferase